MTNGRETRRFASIRKNPVRNTVLVALVSGILVGSTFIFVANESLFRPFNYVEFEFAKNPDFHSTLFVLVVSIFVDIGNHTEAIGGASIDPDLLLGGSTIEEIQVASGEVIAEPYSFLLRPEILQINLAIQFGNTSGGQVSAVREDIAVVHNSRIVIEGFPNNESLEISIIPI